MDNKLEYYFIRIFFISVSFEHSWLKKGETLTIRKEDIHIRWTYINYINI